MKKLIVLLSIVFLFATGCTIKKLDNYNFPDNVDYLLSQKNKLYNVYYDGYKYYLPKGVVFIDKDDYNALIRDQYNNKYFLYVDLISYYHKIENNYKVNEGSFYSKKLDIDNKTGYIQIDKSEDKYFVQFVYNYVKIEAYVDENNLSKAISNMCYIVRSFKYNDLVIESLIGEKALDYKEVEYSLFKADSSKESYLDVVERNETDAYKKDLEDEKINLDY